MAGGKHRADLIPSLTVFCVRHLFVLNTKSLTRLPGNRRGVLEARLRRGHSHICCVSAISECSVPSMGHSHCHAGFLTAWDSCARLLQAPGSCPNRDPALPPLLCCPDGWLLDSVSSFASFWHVSFHVWTHEAHQSSVVIFHACIDVFTRSFYLYIFIQEQAL